MIFKSEFKKKKGKHLSPHLIGEINLKLFGVVLVVALIVVLFKDIGYYDLTRDKNSIFKILF